MAKPTNTRNASARQEQPERAADQTFDLGPDWFERRIDHEPLPLLEKVCRDANGDIDCAVICGMYRPISNDLKRCDHDLKVRAARTWFCHTHAGKACRGNALNLGRAVVREIERIDAIAKAEGPLSG